MTAARRRLAATAVLAALAAASALPPARAATPSVFVSMSAPLRIVSTGGRLLVTSAGDNHVRSIDGAGAVRLFATIPPYPVTTSVGALGASRGLGGWPAGHVYVGAGPGDGNATSAQGEDPNVRDIFEITPDGRTVRLFTTMPATVEDITFDRVGTFGFAMVVTGLAGEVWRVDRAGGHRLLARTAERLAGPEVAPLSFKPFGGHLVGATHQAVVAVSPAGVVAPVVDWPWGTGVAVIPPTACQLGASGGAHFVALQSSERIVKFPAGDFAGLGGGLLVRTGQSIVTPFEQDIGLLTSNGVAVTKTTFHRFAQDGQSGAAFAECPSVSIADASVTEGPGATATLSISRDDAGSPVTVRYATADGTARAGGDYVATSGEVLLAAGEQARDVTIPIVDDASREPDETFSVNVTVPTAGVVVAKASGVVTVIDDDAGPAGPGGGRVSGPGGETQPAAGTEGSGPPPGSPGDAADQAGAALPNGDQPLPGQAQTQANAQTQAQSQAQHQAQSQAQAQAQQQAQQQAQSQAQAQQQAQSQAQAQAQAQQQAQLQQQAQSQAQAQQQAQQQAQLQSQPALLVERQRQLQLEAERAGRRGPNGSALLASRRRRIAPVDDLALASVAPLVAVGVGVLCLHRSRAPSVAPIRVHHPRTRKPG